MGTIGWVSFACIYLSVYVDHTEINMGNYNIDNYLIGASVFTSINNYCVLLLIGDSFEILFTSDLLVGKYLNLITFKTL